MTARLQTFSASLRMPSLVRVTPQTIRPGMRIAPRPKRKPKPKPKSKSRPKTLTAAQRRRAATALRERQRGRARTARVLLSRKRKPKPKPKPKPKLKLKPMRKPGPTGFVMPTGRRQVRVPKKKPKPTGLRAILAPSQPLPGAILPGERKRPAGPTVGVPGVRVPDVQVPSGDMDLDVPETEQEGDGIYADMAEETAVPAWLDWKTIALVAVGGVALWALLLRKK